MSSNELDCQLQRKMFAGRLFHMTGMKYEKERLEQSAVVAEQNVLNKVIIEADWSMSCINFLRHLVQVILTHWQQVELAKEQLGIRTVTCCQYHANSVVLRSLQLTDGRLWSSMLHTSPLPVGESGPF